MNLNFRWMDINFFMQYTEEEKEIFHLLVLGYRMPAGAKMY